MKPTSRTSRTKRGKAPRSCQGVCFVCLSICLSIYPSILACTAQILLEPWAAQPNIEALDILTTKSEHLCDAAGDRDPVHATDHDDTSA